MTWQQPEVTGRGTLETWIDHQTWQEQRKEAARDLLEWASRQPWSLFVTQTFKSPSVRRGFWAARAGLFRSLAVWRSAWTLLAGLWALEPHAKASTGWHAHLLLRSHTPILSSECPPSRPPSLGRTSYPAMSTDFARMRTDSPSELKRIVAMSTRRLSERRCVAEMRYESTQTTARTTCDALMLHAAMAMKETLGRVTGWARVYPLPWGADGTTDGHACWYTLKYVLKGLRKPYSDEYLIDNSDRWGIIGGAEAPDAGPALCGMLY